VVPGVSTGIGWGTTTSLDSTGFRVFDSVRPQADADRLQSELGNGFRVLERTDSNGGARRNNLFAPAIRSGMRATDLQHMLFSVTADTCGPNQLGAKVLPSAFLFPP
jgi:hypothetical protein